MTTITATTKWILRVKLCLYACVTVRVCDEQAGYMFPCYDVPSPGDLPVRTAEARENSYIHFVV